jgi:copper chaperone CopZ
MRSKTLPVLATFALAAALVAGLPCCEAAAATPSQDGSDPKPGEATVVIPVKGMTCGGCESAVKIAVKRLEGIVAVEADHKKGEATVTYVKDKVTVEQIVEAINKTGFKASMPAA